MVKVGSTEPLRAIGLVSLIAIAVNGVIGAGIFALPATIAKILGPASSTAYLLTALIVILICLCFAEAGSMFETSGGPYLYARKAFGNLVGFEVGWIFIVARLTAMAAITNVFVSYLSYFFSISTAFRIVIITLLIASLTTTNLLGIRYSVWAVNLTTIGKLLPLLLFIFCGFFLGRVGDSPVFVGPKDVASLQRASMVLLFAFGGFEFSVIPTEEVIEPNRSIPIAIITAVALTATIYLLIDLVTVATLPNLAAAETPLSSASASFLGPPGATIMTLGAIVSTLGTSSAIVFVGPRMLYALSKGQQAPVALARLHSKYRTPAISIILFGSVVWILAISGTFVQLATANAIARLSYYTTTCMAIPILRRSMPTANRFLKLPCGDFVPFVAVAACIWLLAAVSLREASIAAAILLIGAVVYWSRPRSKGVSA